jgi:peroxiredoxin
VELQANYAAFRTANAEILAVAFMDLSRAQTIAQGVQASYPVLADTDHAVADAYGVYNLLGDGLATPSIFVINRAGQIVWSYISKDANDRPASAVILSHLPVK